MFPELAIPLWGERHGEMALSARGHVLVATVNAEPPSAAIDHDAMLQRKVAAQEQRQADLLDHVPFEQQRGAADDGRGCHELRRSMDDTVPEAKPLGCGPLAHQVTKAERSDVLQVVGRPGSTADAAGGSCVDDPAAKILMAAGNGGNVHHERLQGLCLLVG